MRVVCGCVGYGCGEPAVFVGWVFVNWQVDVFCMTQFPIFLMSIYKEMSVW